MPPSAKAPSCWNAPSTCMSNPFGERWMPPASTLRRCAASGIGSGPAENRAGQWGKIVLRLLREHAILLILTAFIVATILGLVRLYEDSPDLAHAVGNAATVAYALGLLALALLLR